MSAELSIDVRAVSYLVTALPQTNPNHDTWAFTVEWTGSMTNAKRQWAVRRGGSCLSRNGEYVREPSPSSRTETWLRAHRFTFDEAVAMARKALPELRINGLTVADLLARMDAE